MVEVSASLGLWKHVGERGGGVVVSVLVVDGRCLVALLVREEEGSGVGGRADSVRYGRCGMFCVLYW